MVCKAKRAGKTMIIFFNPFNVVSTTRVQCVNTRTNESFSLYDLTLCLHFRYIHRYSRNQSIATTVSRIPTSERTATNFLKKVVLLRLVTPLANGAKSHMTWHCAPPLSISNQQFTTSIDRNKCCLIPTTAQTATNFLNSIILLRLVTPMENEAISYMT